jgi:DNA modification methylase
MTPYYQDDYVTIYHGDCREIVPTLGRFDLCLTDPPYGINGGAGNVNIKRGKGNYAAGFIDNEDYVKSVVIPVIELCIKITTATVLTPGIRCMTYYPQPDSFGCFYQPSATGMQVFGSVDGQPIYYYGKNPTKANMGKSCSFKMVHSDRFTEHPCPKPIQEWKLLLSNISLAGQTILDPFAGSCTTGRAAKDLRRKCVCIELEERYCEIGANRCRQEVLA